MDQDGEQPGLSILADAMDFIITQPSITRVGQLGLPDLGDRIR